MAYEDNVFLNVPFDRRYQKFFHALVFSIHDCGFTAISAAEVADLGQFRVDRILGIIEESQ